MIEDTLAKLESAVKKIEAADPAKKAELLRLMKALKAEVRRLDGRHAEQAESVAGFVDAAAYEVLRKTPSPQLAKLALDGLEQSARSFEASHPALVETVAEICRELSSLGI